MYCSFTIVENKKADERQVGETKNRFRLERGH